MFREQKCDGCEASSWPMSYSCKICGREGLDDKQMKMKSHMTRGHLEGNVHMSSEEMMLHVNDVHLDYLTPSTPERIKDLMLSDDDAATNKKSADLSNWSSPRNSSAVTVSKSTVSSSDYSSVMTTKKDDDQYLISRGSVSAPNSNNNNDSFANNSLVNNENTGHSSPLRSSLNLQLRSPAAPKTVVRDCPMCPYTSECLQKLEEHVNRQHFDLTSPSTHQETLQPCDNTFNCPFCVTSFANSGDLERHVNFAHKDILSPAKGTSPSSDATASKIDTPSCPVCFSSSFKNSADLQAHIEDHFSKTSTPSSITTPDLSTDRSLALDIERREQEARRVREQREFAMLQAQYGMDNQGNFREQSVTNMQRAVYAGKMSVDDYYEKQIGLKVAERGGIDDGSSCTREVIAKIGSLSLSSSNVASTYMCSSVDHYAATYGDKGWGCGYRNMQMMLSSLIKHTGYNDLLYRAWSSNIGGSSSDNPQRSSIPSISRIQKMIEWAWGQGFDTQGAEQLGNKLVNTRKWIGATEMVALLSSLRIKCQLLDFHRPTNADGSHPELFKWMLQYFHRNDDFKPPVYLQHQGHSRTVIGVEQLKNGATIMLILDPSQSRNQMAQFYNTSTSNAAMRRLRVSMASLKARQYQVVAVVGTIDTEIQYQVRKILESH